MYNPELSDGISTMILWGFFLIILISGYQGYKNASPLKTPKIIEDLKNDKIELGYIENRQHGVQVEVVDEVSELKRQVQILELKKKLKELSVETDDSIDDKLLSECVDMMVKLGEKKSEAKARACEILSKHPEITSPDQFISKVYKQ
tara:strand:+ start:213 stop:653 length:441 start_codon:yes stop_codon:yes gene_type:complete